TARRDTARWRLFVWRSHSNPLRRRLVRLTTSRGPSLSQVGAHRIFSVVAFLFPLSRRFLWVGRSKLGQSNRRRSRQGCRKGPGKQLRTWVAPVCLDGPYALF